MPTQNWPVRRAIRRAVRSVVNSGLDPAAPIFAALTPDADGTINIDPTRGTGSATFTRADGATDIAHVRDFENLYKKVPAAEARFQGARRVRNVADYSEDMTSATVGTSGNVTVDTDNITFDTTNGAFWYRRDIDNDAVEGETWVGKVKLKGSGSSVGKIIGVRLYDSLSTNAVAIPVLLTSEYVEYSLKFTTASGTGTQIRFGLDNRTGIVSSANVAATEVVYATDWQLEEVSGQTDQAPSEYVPTEASAVTKYFYTENNNEVAENRLEYSRDFDQWSTSGATPTFSQDEIGYDGQSSKAWTVTENSITQQGVVFNSTTVANDSNTHTYSIFVKKDDSATSYPDIYMLLQGGTSQYIYCTIDRKTGNKYDRSTLGTYTSKVEDYNENYWKIILSLTNNSSGNTTLSCGFVIARDDTWPPGNDATVTGSVVVDQAQLALNTATATETQVETTTAAITNVVGTKTAQWEQTTNLLPYSKDLTDGAYWSTSGTGSRTSTTDSAFTLADTDPVSYYLVHETITIADDSEWHVETIEVRKQETDPGAYPLIWLSLTGGTTQAAGISVNPYDGSSAIMAVSGGATNYGVIQDAGDFWRMVIAVKNNGTGNTSLNFQIYTAYTTNFTSGDATLTGYSNDFRYPTVAKRVFPHNEYVETSGFSITLGKEKPLDDQLHPRSTDYGVTRFARFNKWASSTAYSAGDLIIPDTGSGPAGGNGYYYRCVVAGTSGGSEPTFGTTIGDGTYDNGVVWKCMGKATVAGYLAEPARTNSIADSYDLTTWTQTGTAVSALNAIGIDGVVNHATTLTDDDASSQEQVQRNVTITSTSNTHTSQYFVDKDTDQTRFPEFGLQFTGGTTQFIFVHLNTETGATAIRASAGTVNHWVEDHGTRWRLVLSVTDNATGNNNAANIVKPAAGTVIGVTNVAATGSIVVSYAGLELDTSVPSSPILTTGAADTRDKDHLYYNGTDGANYSDAAGSLFCSYCTLSKDSSGSDQTPIVGTRTGTNCGQLYDGGTANAVYDGTSSDGGGTLTFTKETPKLIPASSRWNATLSEMEAINADNIPSAGGASYDGAFVNNVNELWVGGNTSNLARPFVISDVLIYNKDLGTTKLESMTAYD